MGGEDVGSAVQGLRGAGKGQQIAGTPGGVMGPQGAGRAGRVRGDPASLREREGATCNWESCRCFCFSQDTSLFQAGRKDQADPDKVAAGEGDEKLGGVSGRDRPRQRCHGLLGRRPDFRGPFLRKNDENRYFMTLSAQRQSTPGWIRDFMLVIVTTPFLLTSPHKQVGGCEAADGEAGAPAG